MDNQELPTGMYEIAIAREPSRRERRLLKTVGTLALLGAVVCAWIAWGIQ